MRSITFGPILAFLVAGIAVSGKVSYHGYHVYCVKSENNAADINDVISKLALSICKNTAATGGFAGVVVSPAQVDAFKASTNDMETLVMHGDLEVSVARESEFQ